MSDENKVPASKASEKKRAPARKTKQVFKARSEKVRTLLNALDDEQSNIMINVVLEKHLSKVFKVEYAAIVEKQKEEALKAIEDQASALLATASLMDEAVEA